MVERRRSTGKPVLALGDVGPHSCQVSARPAADHSLLPMCASGGRGGRGDLAGGSVAGCTGSPGRRRYGREAEGMRRRWWLQLEEGGGEGEKRQQQRRLAQLGHGAGRERQRREGEGEWRGSEWRGRAGPLHKHGKVAAKAAQTSHAARAGAHGGHASCSASNLSATVQHF